MFSWEFSFCLFTSYAYICPCIRRHLKETILCRSITWSEMGEQNVQAEKVYSGLLRLEQFKSSNIRKTRDPGNESKAPSLPHSQLDENLLGAWLWGGGLNLVSCQCFFLGGEGRKWEPMMGLLFSESLPWVEWG